MDWLNWKQGSVLVILALLQILSTIVFKVLVGHTADMFCSVLLYCSVLFCCSVLSCFVLFCPVLSCSVLFYPVLFRSVQFISVQFCSVLSQRESSCYRLLDLPIHQVSFGIAFHSILIWRFFLISCSECVYPNKFARFHVSASVRLRSSLFWHSVRRRSVVC
jgi:hypothetical protein